MNFKTVTLLGLLSGAHSVASTPLVASRSTTKSMMASVPEWTMQGMVRTCNTEDTACAWDFTIEKNDGTQGTPCKLEVYACDEDAEAPASQTNGGPVSCGIFTVTSGWSGQFGEGNGFTVLSVVDHAAGLIIWPGYTDTQLVNGQVVTPDQSYLPQSLP